MSIGMGAVVGIWVISGVAFWSAFVALGFRFRSADELDHTPGSALDERRTGRTPERAAPQHVLARTRR